MSGPAVHFNIGVASFRLGRYDRAEAAFRRVAETPAMAALAHYNLGLVALRSGDRVAAERWFSLAERAASDERLRTLATTQLAELSPVAAERGWLGYGLITAGYDDNVALISAADVLGVSGTDDGFAEVQLAISAPLAGAWRFDAGALLVKYGELQQFDQLAAHGAGRYSFEVDRWSNEIGVELAHTMLDGEGFERRYALRLQGETPLPAGWRLRLRYRFNEIDGLDEFEGLSGRRHEAGARLRWQRQPWTVGIGYQLENNDYEDDSLAAQRHQLVADVQRTLGNGWTVSLQAVRLNSDYDDADTGSEERSEVALEVAKALNGRWRVVARYGYADNEADLPEFTYRRQRVSAGFEVTM